MAINYAKFRKMSSYAAADIYGGGVNMLISSYFLAFLTFVEGLDPAIAGLCIMIGKVWDGITDPIMGVIVMRTRTRFGSIRPYFLIGILPVFITYFMLWYSFGLVNPAAKAVYYSFAYILFSTAYTITMIPYEALLPKMVDSYSERTDYFTFRMIFSGVGCFLTTYIYEFIINGGGNTGLSPALKGKFGLMGVLLGLFFALPILITFYGTKEKTTGVTSDTIKNIIIQYGEFFKNSSYRKFFILYFMSAFISGLVITGMTFFTFIILSQDLIMGFTVITIVLTIKGATEIGFFPVNVVLMKKFNKHMPYKTDIPLIIIACVIALFIPLGGSPIFFIISISLLGMGVSCLMFVPMTLQPDLTDVDELISGKRREGICSGLSTLGRKVSQGLAFWVSGAILSASGLSADTPENVVRTAQAMMGVKIIYSIIPIALSVLIIIVSYTYKINAANHTMIKEKIAIKRQKGYTEMSSDEIKECEKITGMNFDKLWIAKKD